MLMKNNKELYSLRVSGYVNSVKVGSHMGLSDSKNISNATQKCLCSNSSTRAANEVDHVLNDSGHVWRDVFTNDSTIHHLTEGIQPMRITNDECWCSPA